MIYLDYEVIPDGHEKVIHEWKGTGVDLSSGEETDKGGKIPMWMS